MAIISITANRFLVRISCTRVGEAVGIDDGIVVDGVYVCPGKVGSMVGYCEGSEVGRFDGCKLGCIVGFLEGKGVGKVGEEGFDVGCAVGYEIQNETKNYHGNSIM